MTVSDDHAASIRQRAELRKHDWMIPVKATLEHKERVLAHLEKQAALPQFTEEQITLAKKFRETYWRGAWLREPEDRRLKALEHACRAIMGGDKAKGDALATTAIWS